MPESSGGMRWASASSPLPDGALAAAAAGAAIRTELGEGPVDLCLAFLSASHLASADAVAGALRSALHPVTLAGATARGIVTREHEVEEGPALSVIAARLPDVEVRPFLLPPGIWSGPVEDEAAFDQLAPGARGAELVLLVGDPFSLEIERVLALFNKFAPGVRVVGGMASAGVRPNGNALFLNDWTSPHGGVAIALSGAIRADVVVSQGCAPIGPPLDVTHVERNIIHTLDGVPALERTQQVLGELPASEQERLAQGLYVGRPARGDASGRGDYLIRNILGTDPEHGVLAVGDLVGLREKIRLHVRDARAAVEDLEMLLSPQAFDSAARGALLFACNGRGRMLFGKPDQDIRTLQEALQGPVPVAGMFCAGEFGPVGSRNFQHGHTASIVILRPR